MVRLWGMWGLAALVFACGGPPRSVPQEDVLILELGGINQPLREALLRFALPGDETLEVLVPVPSPARSEQAIPQPTVSPAERTTAREPEFLTVYLRENETLYGLARTHLGSGSRFRELLDVNGWSEAQASRLPVGTPVKVPLR